jgi:hypothetical protein
MPLSKLQFTHKANTTLSCSTLVSGVAAVFGIAYFLCRFKDIVVASYFVTAIGCALELTAVGLQNREMAYLVQFALYSASLGFHIENADLCRQSLHSLIFDSRAGDGVH